MNLTCEYLQNPECWVEFLPSGTGSLLAVNASPAEVNWYAAKGWKITPLVFSPGLRDKWENQSSSMGASAWSLDVSKIQERFHAIAWNDSFALFQDVPGLYTSVMNLLLPGGQAYLHIRNADYMKPRLRAAGREMFRWAHHSPCEAGLHESEIQKGALWPDFSIFSLEEIVDAAYQTTLEKNNKRIAGMDSWHLVPSEPSEMKRPFVKGWKVIIAARAANTPPPPAAHKEQPALRQVEQPVEHAQIQQLLEQMEYEPAQVLLRNIFHSGRTTAETYNLQGIWHFLQQQPTLAWENFKLAIEKDPENLDFYHNLADASLQCGKTDATRALLKNHQYRNPEIGALLANV